MLKHAATDLSVQVVPAKACFTSSIYTYPVTCVQSDTDRSVGIRYVPRVHYLDRARARARGQRWRSVFVRGHPRHTPGFIPVGVRESCGGQTDNAARDARFDRSSALVFFFFLKLPTIVGMSLF